MQGSQPPISSSVLNNVSLNNEGVLVLGIIHKSRDGGGGGGVADFFLKKRHGSVTNGGGEVRKIFQKLFLCDGIVPLKENLICGFRQKKAS